MDKSAVTLRNTSIPEKAFLAEAQTRQKCEDHLSTAPVAAVRCTQVIIA